MPDENLVPAPDGDEVSTETLTTGLVPQGGTLPQSATDVDKKVLELTQKYERDIANLKSTFQRSESELKKQMDAQRQAYDQHVRELKLSKMDEEERKKYEAQELIERNKNYEAEAQAAKQALEEREQKDQYRDFFLSVGINPQELDFSKDLSTFVNMGYAAWKKKTATLEKKLAELEKKSQSGDEEIPAPEVDTSKGKPTKGPTWADLIKKYGSAEVVYRKIELGQLPVSILPSD